MHYSFRIKKSTYIDDMIDLSSYITGHGPNANNRSNEDGTEPGAAKRDTPEGTILAQPLVLHACLHRSRGRHSNTR